MADGGKLIFYFMFSSSLIKVEAIKKMSEYVAQLRRVGKGHGNTLKMIHFILIIIYFYQIRDCICLVIFLSST